MENLLKQNYDINIKNIKKTMVGAGSDTYFVECSDAKYVVKFPETNEMNNPKAEVKVCELLRDKGISVSRFIKNKQGEYITKDGNGRLFHVQEYIDGTLYDWNKAPDWLLTESAELLGKIHTALKDYYELPIGIGEAFFHYMTPQNALFSYQKSLKTAKKRGDTGIEEDLLYRIELMKRFPKYSFDVSKLTCSATHGDYFISQFICGENKVNAVIDWTSACVHPVVWEIMRSYVYAAPECAKGEINAERLKKYFVDYCKYAELNSYDIKNAAKLFYYQIAVCDYYNQYYSSEADNRGIYLRQAIFSTKLLKWFEKHMDVAGKDPW